MPQLSLILASSSPHRRQLLEAAGYRFAVIPPRESAECGICTKAGPVHMVSELALRKGADVIEQIGASDSPGELSSTASGRVVIACDTVAECGGQILGKPADDAHARDMLERLRGREHRVHSGLVVWLLPDCQPNQKRAARSGQPSSHATPPAVRVATTHLRMDRLTDEQIDEYLDSGQWEGKAGAFGYQDRSGWLHIRRGSESNVIGLPMELLAEMLTEID